LPLKTVAFLFVTALSAMAGTNYVVDVTGASTTNAFSTTGETLLYASWTQTGPGFTGVDVLADLFDTSGSDGTGLAWLVTQVGTGTTSSDEVVGTAQFSIDITNTSPSMTTLFSGLTLGPGTYYLVIQNAAGTLAWVQDSTATPEAAGGVTVNPDEVNLNSPASFPPASTAFGTDTGKAANLLYQVTYTSAVPEPATAGLMLAALGIGALLLRKS
jgi:hypothetical protein